MLCFTKKNNYLCHQMNSNLAKSLVVITIGVVMASIATCLMIKADVGLGSVDSMLLNISKKIGLQMGTITALVYIIAVGVQFFLLGKDFKIRQLLQIPIALIMGVVINFGVSQMQGIDIHHIYWLRVVFLLCGTLLASIGVGAILALGLVHLPIEGACLALAEKKKWNFGVIRWSVDIFSICVTLIFYFFLNGELTIREGTILNMLIFAPILNFFYNYFKKQPFIQEIMIKDPKDEKAYEEEMKNTHM